MEPELRDWYLSTLGIVQYRSLLRQQLPGSAQSGAEPPADPVIVQDVSADLVLDDSNHPSGHAGPESKVGTMPESLRDLVTDDKVNQITVSEPGVGMAVSLGSPQPGEIVTEEKISFRLACWRPSEDLLVLDSWSIGQGNDNRRSQLLANILKSINRRPGNLMQPEFIDWPLVGQGSLSAAQDHLVMFIQGRYEQQAFKWILAMGEDVRLCLGEPRLEPGLQLIPDLDSGERLANSGGRSVKGASRTTLNCGAEVVFTYALSEMIERPECKKDVWAVIRFLSL